jgi:hypothetical protein
MKLIPLTRGYVALVDDEDYERTIGAGKWTALVCKNAVYAHRKTPIERKTILLHRFLLGVTDARTDVDHKNGNGLDCQRSNLRKATRGQNNANRRRFRGASPYKGVFKNHLRWSARIYVDYRKVPLGNFMTQEEAARAYDAAATEHFGEFACLNFPAEVTQ